MDIIKAIFILKIIGFACLIFLFDAVFILILFALDKMVKKLGNL